MAHLPIDSHALRASSILLSGLATVHPVSYTHLDVYKRQV